MRRSIEFPFFPVPALCESLRDVEEEVKELLMVKGGKPGYLSIPGATDLEAFKWYIMSIWLRAWSMFRGFLRGMGRSRYNEVMGFIIEDVFGLRGVSEDKAGIDVFNTCVDRTTKLAMDYGREDQDYIMGLLINNCLQEPIYALHSTAARMNLCYY